jgi:hypothetical protein
MLPPDYIPDDDRLDPEDLAALLDEARGTSSTRHDGWSGERRVAFLEALMAGHKVGAAARSVGMTPQSARRLRARTPQFARIWDETFAFLASELEESAVFRAIHGTERPVMSRGRQVATRVHHHDGLLMRLLAARDPMNYGSIASRLALRKAAAEEKRES